MIAEVRVTDLAVHEHLLDPALREVIVQEQIGLRIDAGGIEFEADAVFGIESFGKARIDDGHEILVFQPADRDRKSVVSGKSVSVRVDLGGSRYIKTKKKTKP